MFVGASITGMMFSDNYTNFHANKVYTHLFFIGVVLMVVALLVEAGAPSSIWYDYFAAMACGLQVLNELKCLLAMYTAQPNSIV